MVPVVPSKKTAEVITPRL
ncbi:hypothetical protein [Chroococcidiopsis sp. CCNUC1]